jgi:hypothetical protein
MICSQLGAGVLTKPDLIRNNLDNCKAIFHNERTYLDSGWYVVKNPDSRLVSWEDSRRDETTYFSNDPSWASEPEEHRRRLGTENLVQALSTRLCHHIAERYVLS